MEPKAQSPQTLVGDSWVVVSGVVNPLTSAVAIVIRGRYALLVTTYESQVHPPRDRKEGEHVGGMGSARVCKSKVKMHDLGLRA